MIIRISRLKTNISELKEPNKKGPVNEEEKSIIIKKICKLLMLDIRTPLDITVRKKSIDARKKHDICYTYTIDIMLPIQGVSSVHIQKALKKLKGRALITDENKNRFSPLYAQIDDCLQKPIICGAGPAGLFAAYILALNGANPILIEQGGSISERVECVSGFWNGDKALNPYSNVSFGEGGAGTFSDGKLNTSVKDTFGRMEYIKRVFVECGAPPEIMYMAKPHIGTDRLRDVIVNLRKEIIRLGGTVHFNTKLTSLRYNRSGIHGIEVTDTITGVKRDMPCNTLILATGHSARDIYTMLKNKVGMSRKDFAVGLRMQHRQSYIDSLQYKECKDMLPPADYSVVYHTKAGRAVYSFCMCPGGYVVNASTESRRLVVNGMSNYDRSSYNANSAIVVSVSGSDFDSDDVLSGMEFQRRIEEAAYSLAQGKIPYQTFDDYKNNMISHNASGILPVHMGESEYANVRSILPEYINNSIIEAMDYFNGIMSGFTDDVLMSGVETRTSAPVRIIRDETLQTDIRGIIPCGEGAGYAGGIMSASADGIKAAFAALDLIKRI